MEKAILSKKHITIVFFIFAFGYFLSTLLRAVTATLSPVLSSEFNLTSGELGLLGGGYFIGFAAMQIPLGYFLDRYGPKKVVTIFLGLAIIGILCFALATNFTNLFIGRVLIGVGVSACLMAPLTGYRVWMEDTYQHRANSWMLMVGSIGMLSSTLPVQYFLPLYGWRTIFLGLAFLTFICICLILLKSPSWNFDKNSTIKREGSLSTIWKNSYFQSLIPIALFNVGGFYSIITLWAGPWMIRVSGYTPLESASGLFQINIIMLFGYLIWGYINPQLLKLGYDANRLLKIGIPFTFISLAIIVIMGPAAGANLWTLYCLCCVVFALTQPAIGLSFPSHLAGKALTSHNLLFFVGIFILQWGIGLVIDFAQKLGCSEVNSFRVAIFILLMLNIFSYIYFVVKNKKG